MIRALKALSYHFQATARIFDLLRSHVWLEHEQAIKRVGNILQITSMILLALIAKQCSILGVGDCRFICKSNLEKHLRGKFVRSGSAVPLKEDDQPTCSFTLRANRRTSNAPMHAVVHEPTHVMPHCTPIDAIYKIQPPYPPDRLLIVTLTVSGPNLHRIPSWQWHRTGSRWSPGVGTGATPTGWTYWPDLRPVLGEKLWQTQMIVTDSECQHFPSLGFKSCWLSHVPVLTS